MVEINASRQRIVESLTAADVPELLATGIVDILVEAGFKKLLAAGSCQADDAALTLVTPNKPSPTSIPGSLRSFPVVKTLPVLVLRYDQQIRLPARKRQHKMHGYARLVAENHQTNVLILTSHDRVA